MCGRAQEWSPASNDKLSDGGEEDLLWKTLEMFVYVPWAYSRVPLVVCPSAAATSQVVVPHDPHGAIPESQWGIRLEADWQVQTQGWNEWPCFPPHAPQKNVKDLYKEKVGNELTAPVIIKRPRSLMLGQKYLSVLPMHTFLSASHVLVIQSL